MTFAYPWPPSLAAGKTLRLFVSSTDRDVAIRIVCISGPSVWSTTLTVPSDDAPAGGPDSRWEWPARDIPIPETATPGAYLAFHDADDGRGAPPVDARSAAALFVVRPRSAEAKIGYVLPLFTYHAYTVATHDPGNGSDAGQGLYTGARAVTLARPGGGIGAHIWDEANVDVYDLRSRRQTYAHWDAKALDWLRRRNVAAEVLTDWEIHTGTASLSDYRLLLFFGHHEYWSDAMRMAVTRFIEAGGNVAFFCGNTCWFRIAYDPIARSIRRLGRWVDLPEDGLTGLSYAFGGAKWIGERPATGYVVHAPEHWIFDGCGFIRGDAFGSESRLAGYECDGLAGDPSARGVPATIERLAEADLSTWDVGDGSGELSATARSTMVAYERGGTVVNCGTADWARLLDVDATVQRITENVLVRLGERKRSLFG